MKARSSQRKIHALMVGASRGIGRALARAFLREGKVVSVIGRRPAAKVARDLRAAGYWALDVCDPEVLNAGLRDIRRKNGRFTHLICFQRYRGSGEDPWQGELETSLSATKRIVEFASDNFDGAKENSIVFVGSIASQFIAEEQPVGYHVAKAALVGMARYYAVTLGPRGIRVNSVSPGTVLKDESKAFYLQNKALLRLYSDLTPLRRMGSADEVAAVIRFFCSPAASFVTGQNIVVDGGVSVQSHESLARRFRGMIHPQVKRG
jgi:NAD(P)-dependent dehydrogenase (short-subunit alcohol dehydrogenase family)